MHAPERDALIDETGGGLVIEADSAEEALALVRDRLGDDAEIVEARKVRRGGWKGFFALERVELTARPGPASTSRPSQPRTSRPPQPPQPPQPPTAPRAPEPVASAPADTDSVVAVRQRLDDEHTRDRADFDRMLRQLLEPAAATPAGEEASSPPPSASPPSSSAPRTRAAPTASTEPPSTATDVGPARAREGRGVAWGRHGLEALRLPRRVVDACADLEREDDLAWVHAIADTVDAWCRPLPAGVPAYVGPRLGRAARSLDVPLVRFGAADAPAGPVALEAPDTQEGRAWAARLAGDRWLHVVATGRRWQGFVFEDVLAVSWTAPDQLPMALAIVERLGLVLGHGPGDQPSRLVRATPVDVALAVRSLIPRA